MRDARNELETKVMEAREAFVRTVLNSLSDEPTEIFVEQMTREHRTLQQNMTKLAVEWLKQMAKTEMFDLRNQASVELAKKLLEGKTEYDLALPTV